MKTHRKTAAALALFAAFTLFAAPSTYGAEKSFPPCPCERARAASRIDESLRPVQLAVNTHNFVDYDEGEAVLRCSRTIVSFVGSPAELHVEALQKALWDYSTEAENKARKTRETMLPRARGDRAERRAAGAKTFYAYMDKNDVWVRRADTLAVSLLEDGFNYEGGVHGISGVFGRNFDAKTGQALSLSDVIVDKSGLASIIIKQLLREYPDASFAESGGASIAETIEKCVGDDTVSWTLDPAGVTFNFNPYRIGAYSEGVFTTTVLFAEHPELFAEKYCRAPQSYCMEIRPYLPVRAAFADGGRAQLKLTTSDGGLRVVKDGVILDDWGEIAGLRPVLVSLADGRRYLYVDGVSAGDAWERTAVYDLNGDAPVRVPTKYQFTRRANVAEDFAEAERGPIKIDENRDKVFYIMADPEHFNMTLLDEETGTARLCDCRVGADGAPEIIR